MSILFGPLSDTMSSVSWRDCALAGDQIAGAAGSALPAASAVTDLRNSRRFICNLPIGMPHRAKAKGGPDFTAGRARHGGGCRHAPPVQPGALLATSTIG